MLGRKIRAEGSTSKLFQTSVISLGICDVEKPSEAQSILSNSMLPFSSKKR